MIENLEGTNLFCSFPCIFTKFIVFFLWGHALFWNFILKFGYFWRKARNRESIFETNKWNIQQESSQWDNTFGNVYNQTGWNSCKWWFQVQLWNGLVCWLINVDKLWNCIVRCNFQPSGSGGPSNICTFDIFCNDNIVLVWPHCILCIF